MASASREVFDMGRTDLGYTVLLLVFLRLTEWPAVHQCG